MTDQKAQPYVTLNNGTKMPLMGIGTLMYTLQTDDDAVARMVATALEIGYRHIDTAQVYNSEVGVGRAVRSAIESGHIKRDDVFITTKLWRTHLRRNEVVPSLRKSLEKMQLPYVDLFLIHWPTAFQPNDADFQRDANGQFLWETTDHLETWKAMEECVDLGLTKSIGLSNFNSKQITNILEHCRIKPANCQLESHPYLVNRKIIDFCLEKGISVAAYAPLFGFAPKKRAERGWPTIYTDATIGKIAQKHQKTPAQVALRFQIQRGIAVLPKSEKKERLLENFQALTFELTKEDMEEIEKCDQKIRLCDDDTTDHPHYPFSEEF